MSDLVTAVAEKLGGAPEELVLRSAQARAAAQGVSVDEVLAAWAGGASVASAPAPAATEPPAPAAAPAPAATEPPAPAAAPETDEAEAPAPAEAPAAAAAVAAPAPAAVAVLEEDEEVELVEPAALRDRVRFGLAVGAVVGAMLGVIGMVLSSPLILNRAAVAGDGNDAAVAVTAGATVITIGIVSGVFGAIIAMLARAVPRFTGPEYAVRGTARSAAVTGAISGLVLGFVGGGVLIATGVEALDGGTLLVVRSGLLVVFIGGAVLGALTGAVSQLVTIPAALVEEDFEEVKDRISNAVMVPAVAAIGIVGFVVPLGTLLVEFHEFAPLIGIAVSGLILAFAFLMSTSPRISRAEFLVAAAGVGVTLLLIAAVASQIGGGEDGEEHAQLPAVLQVF